MVDDLNKVLEFLKKLSKFHIGHRKSKLQTSTVGDKIRLLSDEKRFLTRSLLLSSLLLAENGVRHGLLGSKTLFLVAFHSVEFAEILRPLKLWCKK